MDTVLITGAGGFAGGHLVEYLAGRSNVVAWARSKPPQVLANLGHWHLLDLLNRDYVRDAIRELQPKTVYHCAGSPHVAGSWDDPVVPLETNVLATHNLLDALRRTEVGTRVLIVGSAYVYMPSNVPIREDDPVAPVGPYAVSKLAQEVLGLRAIEEDGLEVLVARAFNHTGPRQSDDFVAPSFARQIALIERGNRDRVLRVGNLSAQRDLSDVRDVVRAYALIMETGLSGTVYNVASGTARPIRWLLDELIARARIPISVETDPERLRPSDVPVLVGDASRLRAVTGWKPKIDPDQMLNDLLEYWRSCVAD
jgi:GDP-4-dehydro-6-deoxy-D-mannose reductase